VKKALIYIFLSLSVLLLAAGIFGKLIYDSVTEDQVPLVSVSVFGAELEPVGYSWYKAVFNGLAYKEFVSDNKNAAVDIGEFLTADAAVELPGGYDAAYELIYDDIVVSAGSMDQWNEGLYGKPGSYELLILLEKLKEKYKEYGSFSFWIQFTVQQPAPEFFTGKTSLAQGEIFVIKLTNVADGVTPFAVTDLGLSVFTPEGGGEWFAAIPVGNTRAPGNYTVAVSDGTYQWEAEVQVQKYNFDTQNLIIDTSNPEISEANSARAYEEYREKIPPLFDTYDSEIYWTGAFIMPVSGRISTQFGTIRYTNGNWSNPRYHWGVDIAADRGTPVAASGGGRVVLAEYLLNTGNTVVIEHGGGLKSYYFHMDALHVNAGEMVQKGARIGDVGSTGYSTGAHLHFETRIGDQAVNPLMLCETSSSLYSFNKE